MWLNNLKVGKKIGGGFGLVLLLMAVSGLLVYTGVGGIVDNAQEVIAGNKLDGSLAQKEVDHLAWATKVNSFLTDSRVKKLDVQINPRECGFGRWYYGQGRKDAETLVPTLAPLLAAIESPHTTLHDSARLIKQRFRQPHPGLLIQLSDLLIKHLVWTNTLCSRVNGLFLKQGALAGVNRSDFRVDVEMDPDECALGVFLASDYLAEQKKSFPQLVEVMDAVVEPHNRLHASAARIQQMVRDGQVEKAALLFQNETLPTLKKVKQLLNQAIDAEAQLQKAAEDAMMIYATQTQPSLEKVQELIEKIRKESRSHISTDQTILSAAMGLQLQVITISLVTLLLGISGAAFLTRAMTKPLQNASTAINTVASGDFTIQLDEDDISRKDELGMMLASLQGMSDKLSSMVHDVMLASVQVASSASQMSNGNQELNIRTQQQAAGVQQTASALEQMTSSVKNTANSSSQANKLASFAAELARRGGDVLNRTVDAMDEVSKSSRKISEIITIVNEIAFQTNLLALNAAVEAARAGDAGRGFAVVAGEVRNLAGRSAKAAGEIQTLIGDSVGKVEHVSDLVVNSGKILGEIIDNVRAVADAVVDISAASQQQAQGIDEVNKAVTQMDQTIQQNAALVEEVASTSEEQASVAEQLRAQMSQFKVDRQRVDLGRGGDGLRGGEL